MASDCRCKFVLLDFGHPMNANSMNNIINSLENILALALAFPRNAREMTFGISILNSDFIIFESESQLRRNYGSIVRHLNGLLKSTKANSRVTVHEYKCLLSRTIETVLQEFQKFTRGNEVGNESSNSFIQIAVVTKKTASVLAEILTDVTHKLQNNNESILSVKNYKIVYILDKHDIIRTPSDKNMSIDWTFCSDNIYNLNCFFKEWLMNNQQQQLQISLSKELNLEIRCDVDDCIVSPVSIVLNEKLGILKPPAQLEIINRIPTKGFCPTFVLGIPRRVSATRSLTLQWTESQINSKMFEQLCRQLYRNGEGLLARSALSVGKDEIHTFHLLTSDGNVLLMNDVAPEELYLPSDDGVSKSVASSGDENAANLMEACFDRIKYLNEYNPKHYSSGVYRCLKDYLVKAGQSKSLFGHFDPNVKLFGKKPGRKEHARESAGELSVAETSTKECETGRKKRQKPPGSEIEVESVHPALLSANLVEKYRKIDSQAFELPELSNVYNDNIKSPNKRLSAPNI